MWLGIYSPTPDKILEAIKAVDTGDGVLLVVKNYAGDVMNFEMAQELAEMEGINVEESYLFVTTLL
ncbi:dihydroxyacetone kinase subunit DhaK [Staphylococcus aureus]